MAAYPLTWITDHLAVGHAPMSYAELDAIREQSIDAIVNLCGEYCDLHEIEREYGFEVFYLPVDDDRAPALEELEKGLEWLDEAIYLGKKVLVHCRMGMGRTGTFVTSYLLRRGFGIKLAKKKLKNFRSNPTSFDQWWFLRKYRKREGELSVREPSLEGGRLVDLGPYFAEYEALAAGADAAFEAASARASGLGSCGAGTDGCCSRFLSLQLMETAYVSHHLNRRLTREERLASIERAVEAAKGGSLSGESHRCPLSVEGRCILYDYRPLECRVYGLPVIHRGERIVWGNGPSSEELDKLEAYPLDDVKEELFQMSRRLFFAFNSTFLEDRSLLFPLTHVVSGKFVQDYFALLAGGL